MWYPAGAALIGTASLLLRYSRSEPGWSPTVGQRVLAVVVAVAMLVGTLAFSGDRLDPAIAAAAPAARRRQLFTGILGVWLATPILLSNLIADDALFDPRRLIVGGLPYCALVRRARRHLPRHRAGWTATVRHGDRRAGAAFNVIAALTPGVPVRTAARARAARHRTCLWPRPRGAACGAGRRWRQPVGCSRPRRGARRGGERRRARAAPARRGELAGQRTAALGRAGESPDFARGPITALLTQAGVRGQPAAHRRAAATRAELGACGARPLPFFSTLSDAICCGWVEDPLPCTTLHRAVGRILRYTVEAEAPGHVLSDELACRGTGRGARALREPAALSLPRRSALLSASVQPLLLQPLVENSLKHGIAPGVTSLRMTLDAGGAGGWFELEFADDGVPHGNGAPSLGIGSKPGTTRPPLRGAARAR